MRLRLWLVVLIALLAGTGNSNAGLKLCNKTVIPLWVAVGYRESGHWMSEGWWKIAPQRCITPIGGDLKGRYYYYRAENKQFNAVWEGEYTFCVDPNSSFEPTNQDACPGHYETEKFIEIDADNHRSASRGLTCSTCSNPYIELSGASLNVGYLHRDWIEGRQLSFPSIGRFSASKSDDMLRLNYDIVVSLRDLQEALSSMLRPQVDRSNDCGEVVRLENVSLTPDNSGRARVDLNVHVEKWYCTYADIPETTCEDTWISLPFGGKTKGIPSCTVRMVTRQTSKNRLIETGLSGTLLLTPSISSRNIVRLTAEVTNVRVRNDLVRSVVDVLNINLRSLAQRELEKNLGNGGAIEGAVPNELKPYFKIDTAKFFDEGNGVLAIRASGTTEVTISQIAELCREYVRFC